MSDLRALKAAIDVARANPALGRSAPLSRLFDYLADSSLAERTPKETEVAIEVFGRRPDFDASRDPIARVYVHKLRRRLEECDAPFGGGLSIPRGQYRLALREDVPPDAIIETPRYRRLFRRFAIPATVAAAVLVAGLLGWNLWTATTRAEAMPARSAVWKAVINNGKPTIVVVGDYYIFADTEVGEDAGKLVREYTVNSRTDLDRFREQHPDRAAGYMDMGLSYLAVGSAGALMNVTRALEGAHDVRVLPVSQLKPAMIRDNNIVYIGYLSGLGILREATFAGSRYAIGQTYDDIIDTASGQQFASGGGGKPQASGKVYSDYGYFSTFRGPRGNRFVIIAGTRDAGLMEMGQAAINRAVLDGLSKAGGQEGAAEALYGVDGMDQVNVSDHLILSSPLKQGAIWRQDGHPSRVFPEG